MVAGCPEKSCFRNIAQNCSTKLIIGGYVVAKFFDVVESRRDRDNRIIVVICCNL